MKRLLLISQCLVILLLTSNINAEAFTGWGEIIEHMAVMQYKCTEMENNNQKHLVCKTDKSVPNILIKYMSTSGSFLLSSFYVTDSKAKSKPDLLFELANSMNKTSQVIRAYIDNDKDLRLEAWVPIASYEREIFSKTINGYEQDWRLAVENNQQLIAKLLN